MIPAKIENAFIEITTDFLGIIKQRIAGKFVEKEFIINESIFDSCPFLIGTLEALPFNEPLSIQAMIIVSEKKEYNVDLELFKSNKEVSVLIENRTNIYKFVDQLNQSRNDIFFIKREIAEKNKELAKLKKVADKANEEKSRFLAMMSHEVRNPLNSILGYTEMISDEKMSQKAKEYVNYLALSGKNLKVIVNDILDLSRIEAGKLELVSKEISIKQIAKTSFLNFKNQQKNKDVKLLFSVSDNIPDIVLGDEIRVTQILSNLLSNSLKFTKSGVISINVKLVSVRKEISEICFEIVDTGRGMTAEQTAKIFEEYEQTDINDNRVFGGAGLGLSIVKRLVEAMNGTISVASTIDVGTTFSIEIPFLKYKKQETKEKEKQRNFKKITLNNKRVLLADDDLLNQKITLYFLQRVEASVTIVSNGSDALEVLKKEKFDIVLLDINMPEVTGEELIKLKSTFKNNNKTPFIALTGNATKQDRENYLKIGFIEVIFKPFKANELITKIDSCI